MVIDPPFEPVAHVQLLSPNSWIWLHGAGLEVVSKSFRPGKDVIGAIKVVAFAAALPNR